MSDRIRPLQSKVREACLLQDQWISPGSSLSSTPLLRWCCFSLQLCASETFLKKYMLNQVGQVSPCRLKDTSILLTKHFCIRWGQYLKPTSCLSSWAVHHLLLSLYFWLNATFDNSSFSTCAVLGNSTVMAKFVIKLPKPLLDEEWPFYHTFYTVVLGVRATKMSDGLAPPPKKITTEGFG